jgi:hypothetical protein
MAALEHGLFQLGTADGEHPRRTEPRADDLTQDLERRQHLVRGCLDAETFEPGLQRSGPRAGIVGEKADAPALAPQEREHLGGAGHEHVARPHTAIQIEDESPGFAQRTPARTHERPRERRTVPQALRAPVGS